MNRNQKKAAILFIIFILIFGSGSSAVLKTKSFNAPEKLFNRYTIQTFRSVLETAGAVVTWNEKKRMITVEDGTDSTYLDISTDTTEGVAIFINNEYIGQSPVSKRLFDGEYQIKAKLEGHVATVLNYTLTNMTGANQEKGDRLVLQTDNHGYQEFIDEILRYGYKPIRVMDYYNQTPITPKTIVLRHDVDLSADYALKMARIEHAKGITSTYYFRWSTADAAVINEIRNMGFEVGLHYETLATYSKKHKLKSAKDLTPKLQTELRNQLRSEIEEFRQQFGEIYTIASHGDEENTRLGLTNYQAIMEGENPQDYGIIGTAYGPITNNFTYLSDSGGIWKPFPYPKLMNNTGPFYILVHPVHWKSNI